MNGQRREEEGKKKTSRVTAPPEISSPQSRSQSHCGRSIDDIERASASGATVESDGDVCSAE